MKLEIKKLDQKAKLPKFAHRSDVGMDLFCVEETILSAGERIGIKTGIAMAIPENHVGLILDKSGLALKHGLTTMAGVIDSGYRGEIVVVMYNTSQEDYTFAAGHKVAQMLIQKVAHPEILETNELPTSDRGEDNFGSTGK